MLNKQQKINLVNQYPYLFRCVINDGYDCPQAFELERILKQDYGYKDSYRRRELLISFIRIWCGIHNPGYLVVGAGQLKDHVSTPIPEGMSIPTALNSEEALSRNLVEKRVWEFIRMENIINK